MVQVTVSVPAAVPADDELTAEWFTGVMDDASGGATVVEARVEPMVTADVGWFGRLLRVHLRYDPPGSGPATVVVKRDPEAEFVRDIGFDMGFFGRETGFYRELASEVPLRVPRCHHAAIDAETRTYVIVLEDLGTGRFGDQVTGCTPAELHVLADELATLHAWGTTISPPEWAASIRDIAPPYLDYGETFDTFAGHLRGAVPDAAVTRAQQLGDRLDDIYSAIEALPGTVAHSDFRLDNVVFDLDARPVVYDWQSTSYTPGAMDLASIVVLSLEHDVRRGIEDSVIGSYRERLADAGVALGDDEFRRAYGLGVVHFFLLGMLAFSTDPTRPVFVDWTRRTSHALAELDLDALL